MGWEIYPDGLHHFLTRMARDYVGQTPIYVTENGMANADQLEDGQVVGFDSKEVHSLDPVSQERWALSWRCIKPEYLNCQLVLFD